MPTFFLSFLNNSQPASLISQLKLIFPFNFQFSKDQQTDYYVALLLLFLFSFAEDNVTNFNWQLVIITCNFKRLFVIFVDNVYVIIDAHIGHNPYVPEMLNHWLSPVVDSITG